MILRAILDYYDWQRHCYWRKPVTFVGRAKPEGYLDRYVVQDDQGQRQTITLAQTVRMMNERGDTMKGAEWLPELQKLEPIEAVDARIQREQDEEDFDTLRDLHKGPRA